MASKKTRTDLIAENEALRSRVADLERGAEILAYEKGDQRSKLPPHGKRGEARGTLSIKMGPTKETVDTPIPVLFSFVDAEQHLHFHNQSFVDWFGGKLRHAGGKHLREALGNANYRQILPSVQRALAGQAQAFEWETPGPDGETRILQTQYVPQFGENRVVLGFEAIILDITEHKRARGALTQSENKIRAITDSVPALITYVDKGHRFQFNNKTYEDWFGIEPGQFVGKHMRDALGKNAYQKILPWIEGALAGEEQVFEVELPYQNAKKRFVHLHYVPHFDEHQQVVGFFAGIIDITERKKAEQALLESESRLAEILNGAEDAIISVDQDQKIVLFNKGAEKIFGFREKEAQGQLLDLLLPESAQTAHRRHLLGFAQRPAGAAQTFARGEIIGKRKNGENFPAEASISKVKIGGKFVFTAFLRDITARKRAEAALRSSQMLLETVFNTVPHGLWAKDRDGVLLKVNPTLAETYNFTPADLEGRRTEDAGLGTAEVRAVFSEMDRQVFETGKTVVFPVLEVTLPKGEKRLRQVTELPMVDQHGNVTGLVGISEDITERKRAENELQESEAKYRDLVETSHDLIWRLDREGCFTYLNPAWEKTLGYKPEEMLGRRFTEFKDLVEAARTLKVYQATLAGGNVGNFETAYISKSGQVLNLNFNALPVFDTLGKIIGTQGTAQDITQRKRAEDALRESSLRYQTLIEQASDGIFISDSDGRYLEVNVRGSEMFRCSQEELIQLNILDFLPPEEGENFQRRHNQIMGGKVVMFEREVLRRDGSRFPAEFSAKKLGNGMVLAIVRDITNRKSLEEQLRQSQKIQALGTLAGGVAHDFNNILSPILGFSEMLMEDLEYPSGNHAAASDIFKGAKRAKELVSQILLFGRRGQAEKKVTDLVAMLGEVALFVRSTLPKTINIRKEGSTDLAPVFCDPSQVYQLIFNLCLNAGQAIPASGEITLFLGLEELEQFECLVGRPLSGKFVRIAVTDNGIGMDEETLKHIFEPFFTTKGVGEGTGLGLSTVYGIVQEHGGGINVSTEPGFGSTFEVLLPLAESPIEELPEKRDSIQHRGRENILFVDDEEAITRLGKVSLERAGYKVTTVLDGRKALNIFRANPGRFKLVLTDQTMPKMTGEILTQELRKIRPDIPVILCSGNGETKILEKSEFHGINRFLLKPILPSELTRVVQEVLIQAGVVSGRP